MILGMPFDLNIFNILSPDHTITILATINHGCNSHGESRTYALGSHVRSRRVLVGRERSGRSTTV